MSAVAQTMPVMDYRDPQTQCREELSNCLLSLEQVCEALRPTTLALRHLEECLDALFLGPNPVASENAINAAQILLRVFLRDFEANEVAQASPEVFDLYTRKFADTQPSSQWAHILSDEGVQFCVIVRTTIERLQYCKKNGLTFHKDDEVLNELFDAFGPIKNALQHVDTSEKSLRTFYQDSNALGLTGQLFENEVYCHLMRSILPAVQPLLERVFNRLGHVDYLTMILSEVRFIQRQDEEIAGLDSSARMMLIDLGGLSTSIYSLESLVDPHTWSESVLGCLLSTVLTMIRAMERLERVLDYRRLAFFTRLNNEGNLFQAYRDLRKIVRLLGRVDGSSKRSVSTAFNGIKDNAAIVLIPGVIEALRGMESSPMNNPRETRVVACELWKSYIRWLRVSVKNRQQDASDTEPDSAVGFPSHAGCDQTPSRLTDLCSVHPLRCQ